MTTDIEGMSVAPIKSQADIGRKLRIPPRWPADAVILLEEGNLLELGAAADTVRRYADLTMRAVPQAFGDLTMRRVLWSVALALFVVTPAAADGKLPKPLVTGLKNPAITGPARFRESPCAGDSTDGRRF